MTSSSWAIRTARAREIVALHDLWLSAADRADWAPATHDGSPLLAELDVLVADRRVWAAFDDSGAPIGFSAAGEIDSSLFLTVFGVADNARGSGIGHALLSPILEFGRSAFYPALIAVARRHGAGALFLRQCGFVDLAGSRLSPGFASIVDDGRAVAGRTALARRL